MSCASSTGSRWTPYVRDGDKNGLDEPSGPLRVKAPAVALLDEDVLVVERFTDLGRRWSDRSVHPARRHQGRDAAARGARRPATGPRDQVDRRSRPHQERRRRAGGRQAGGRADPDPPDRCDEELGRGARQRGPRRRSDRPAESCAATRRRSPSSAPTASSSATSRPTTGSPGTSGSWTATAARSPRSPATGSASTSRGSRAPTTTSSGSPGPVHEPLRTLVVACALSLEIAVRPDARGV